VNWQELWGWLRRLPEALVRRRPGLLLAHANVDHWRGRLASMSERLRAATALLDAGDQALPPADEAIFRAQADDLTALTCPCTGATAPGPWRRRGARCHTARMIRVSWAAPCG
jgi:hypothetical protein